MPAINPHLTDAQAHYRNAISTDERVLSDDYLATAQTAALIAIASELANLNARLVEMSTSDRIGPALRVFNVGY